MFVIYEAVREQEVDRKSEESELIHWTAMTPSVGDLVLMGSDPSGICEAARQWRIVQVEAYQFGTETIYLAMVSRADLPTPDESSWRAIQRRNFSPNASFDLQLSPSRQCLGYGWNMNGEPPSGQLQSYEPTGRGSLMQSFSRPWVINQVETYQPQGESTYRAIHLCWCAVVEAVGAA